jgi:hypothetical protein
MILLFYTVAITVPTDPRGSRVQGCMRSAVRSRRSPPQAWSGPAASKTRTVSYRPVCASWIETGER